MKNRHIHFITFKKDGKKNMTPNYLFLIPAATIIYAIAFLLWLIGRYWSAFFNMPGPARPFIWSAFFGSVFTFGLLSCGQVFGSVLVSVLVSSSDLTTTYRPPSINPAIIYIWILATIYKYATIYMQHLYINIGLPSIYQYVSSSILDYNIYILIWPHD